MPESLHHGVCLVDMIEAGVAAISVRQDVLTSMFARSTPNMSR
jgi:hypothetical protein